MEDSLLSLLLNSPDFQQIVFNAVQATLDEKANEPKPIFYTEDEVCKLLHISKPTCFKYRKLGIIKGSKVGSRLLFTQEAVNSALTEIPAVKYRRV